MQKKFRVSVGGPESKEYFVEVKVPKLKETKKVKGGEPESQPQEGGVVIVPPGQPLHLHKPPDIGTPRWQQEEE